MNTKEIGVIKLHPITGSAKSSFQLKEPLEGEYLKSLLKEARSQYKGNSSLALFSKTPMAYERLLTLATGWNARFVKDKLPLAVLVSVDYASPFHNKPHFKIHFLSTDYPNTVSRSSSPQSLGRYRRASSSRGSVLKRTKSM